MLNRDVLWTSVICSVCYLECMFGSFGSGCSQTCHCSDNASCNHVDGLCSTGCADGWQGPTCSQATQGELCGVNVDVSGVSLIVILGTCLCA